MCEITMWRSLYRIERMTKRIFLCLWLIVFCGIGAAYKSANKNEEHNPYLEALHKHPWESNHGYVKVRRDAFMFWWLYYADGTHKRAEEKPLVIWIQGGPGLAATGVANFAELGPFTMNLEQRNHTWVKGRNVLFIDHPVGTGFSYTVNTNTDLYATRDRRVALDLLRAIRGFLKVHREFEHVPTYITSQSYGGKIAPRLTYMLHKAIKGRYLKMDLKGVGIGSSWVDPVGISKVLPDYLYHMGIIDVDAYRSATRMSNEMQTLFAQGKLNETASIDESIYRMYQYDIKSSRYNHIESFLNVAKPQVDRDLRKLEQFINRYVKPTLSMVNQSLTWKFESDKVFYRLQGNLMLPSIKYVERLLNETDLKVVVYNGNLDATCPMAGAVNWVHKLRWRGAEHFRSSVRQSIPGYMTGYYKSWENLSLWWVLNAGHWVPEDNPEAMEKILQYLMNDEV